MPHIYLGTGGYSDTDLFGTLYPFGTAKADFLHHYSRHYDTVEINSTFHAPIGTKALQGMLEKAAGRLRFAIKLHQDFSHKRTATAEQAQWFLQALQPLIDANALAALFVQFPHTFERTPLNRHYLARLTDWFADYPLAVEFRHASWHIPPVFDAFRQKPNLIWCNVDYPANIGLPAFEFQTNQRVAYLRLHGRNPHWWQADSAQARHDYRYGETELAQLAQQIARQPFDELYLYFQNTTQSHAFYNIATLKGYLMAQGFSVKEKVEEIRGEQWGLF
ncbi:DUF72 domain-containing protein [Muribacter muris]|uniref:DUF72 domain-containing protein n=1 Tax=Muribacter muris TaxID=67855 RepID=A0A4Y9K0K7_9PAST|nr:DUF72 domain-containing protein [Muribacter muris]MBF0785067.1 DUF72 domain-containing protein [Muribacter muris]MBF0826718.1 DUF72 domain-containing protein [Muribacter muris]TFV10307.1 DUF72 domain-containing protein [Muribacter muris]